MAIGQVSFKNDRLVKRVHVAERINAIVNRLAKTKVEREIDHEAVRVEREKEAGRKKKELAAQLRKEQLEKERERQKQVQERSYDSLFSDETVAEARAAAGSDDEFM